MSINDAVHDLSRRRSDKSAICLQ